MAVASEAVGALEGHIRIPSVSAYSILSPPCLVAGALWQRRYLVFSFRALVLGKCVLFYLSVFLSPLRVWSLPVDFTGSISCILCQEGFFAWTPYWAILTFATLSVYELLCWFDLSVACSTVHFSIKYQSWGHENQITKHGRLPPPHFFNSKSLLIEN